jgi:8-oxo-dGTP pyrophosphatase MutT (NUDIX family)
VLAVDDQGRVLLQPRRDTGQWAIPMGKMEHDRYPERILSMISAPGDGLDGRSEKTVTLNRDVLKAVVDRIGKRVLRELTAQDVRRALTEIAATRSSRTVVVAHNALVRAIRHATAKLSFQPSRVS